MTLFWTITGIAIAIPVLLLAPVLLRGPKRTGSDDNRAHNVSIAREHLAELEAERERGGLSEEEFAQASHDLEIALAEDLETSESQSRKVIAGSRAGRAAFVATLAIVPLLTLGLYQRVGAPEFMAVAGPGKPPGADAHAGTGEKQPSIDELVGKLEARLRQQPNNPEGWMMLGRTYMKLQRYADAVNAFDQLVEVAPAQPAALLALADARAMQNNRIMDAGSEELVLRALELAPRDLTALWLAGKAANDLGRPADAVKHWRTAYPLLADEPRMQDRLGAMIREAGGEVPDSGRMPPIMAAAGATPAPVAGSRTATGDGPRIPVQIALDSALFEQAPENATVFVFAKAVSGPPMPLAVSRHRVADLPLAVELTDAMAMMPQMRISSFDKVAVSARVSLSGQPTAQPGDLQSPPVVVETATPGNVQLLINEVVN